MRKHVANAFILLITVVIFLGYLNAGTALFIGLAFALIMSPQQAPLYRKYSGQSLKIAVIGMGFGIHINSIVDTLHSTFWLTLSTIIAAFAMAWLLFQWLNVEKKTSVLLASGTAICGGSAIAAISQVIRSRPDQTAVALTVVFLLNMVALYIFPIIGHALEMTQQEFGIWAALAIHDTSSVVGAASEFGDEALQVATTTKLSRALWILPLTIIFSILFKQEKTRVTIPVFILLFILTATLSSVFTSAQSIFDSLFLLSKRLMVFALFLLGLGFTRKVFQQIDSKPLIFAVLLWLFLAAFSLSAVFWLNI